MLLGIDLRVGSSKSTWVDLGLPSGVESVCSSVTVEIFWCRRSMYKSLQVYLKSIFSILSLCETLFFRPDWPIISRTEFTIMEWRAFQIIHCHALRSYRLQVFTAYDRCFMEIIALMNACTVRYISASHMIRRFFGNKLLPEWCCVMRC